MARVYRKIDKLLRDPLRTIFCASDVLSMKSLLAKPKGKTISPFHHAFPVYDLEETRHFYRKVMKCPQGREHPNLWIGIPQPSL
jgi:hypothetical protein